MPKVSWRLCVCQLFNESFTKFRINTIQETFVRLILNNTSFLITDLMGNNRTENLLRKSVGNLINYYLYYIYTYITVICILISPHSCIRISTQPISSLCRLRLLSTKKKTIYHYTHKSFNWKHTRVNLLVLHFIHCS